MSNYNLTSLIVACLTELVHGIVGRYVYNFQPLFTKAEVGELGVLHIHTYHEQNGASFNYTLQLWDTFEGHTQIHNVMHVMIHLYICAHF